MKIVAKCVLCNLLGWKIVGEFPEDLKKYVVIAAPHTSYWDFPLGVLLRCTTNTHIHFVGKKSLFRKPIGFFFTSMGGFPVDRTKCSNTVDALVEKFNKHDEFILGISPEGTRKKVDSWKTGYYYVAKGAGVAIVKVALDFKNKQILIDTPFFPTDKPKEDMAIIKQYFHGISGKFAHLS